MDAEQAKKNMNDALNNIVLPDWVVEKAFKAIEEASKMGKSGVNRYGFDLVSGWEAWFSKVDLVVLENKRQSMLETILKNKGFGTTYNYIYWGTSDLWD